MRYPVELGYLDPEAQFALHRDYGMAITNTKTGYEIEVPGRKPDDIQISQQGRKMVIKVGKAGHRKAFSYSLTLSDMVDAANISATLSAGVLTINLPTTPIRSIPVAEASTEETE